ncbi:hypothetical protein ABID26_003831 [Mesorhizobium shonense]|uniref:Uncharacterized protein n=1 Tax=Mesorhizobium shonense TaxID=1209948 RepID=A0ABV2HVR9_9HYPH
MTLSPSLSPQVFANFGLLDYLFKISSKNQYWPILGRSQFCALGRD